MSSTAQPTKPIEVFYSYAHKDEGLRHKLEMHLRDLQRQGIITNWYDRDINAGTEWADKIDDHLNSAQIILLLISPDFLASDYCYSIEVKRALERHELGEARVIPIVLRPANWYGAPFGEIKVLPTDGKTLVKWQNRDMAFIDITSGIRKAIAEFLTSSTSKSIQKAKQQWFEKGDVAFERKDYEDALAAYEQAIHFDAKDAIAYISKANALHKLKRYKEALVVSPVCF